jgi:hypothetical protein
MLGVWRVRNPFDGFWKVVAAQVIFGAVVPAEFFLRGYPTLRYIVSEIFIVLFWAFGCISVVVTIVAVIADARRPKPPTNWPQALKRFGGAVVIVSLCFLGIALMYHLGALH